MRRHSYDLDHGAMLQENSDSFMHCGRSNRASKVLMRGNEERGIPNRLQAVIDTN